jgi:hypothetical protein
MAVGLIATASRSRLLLLGSTVVQSAGVLVTASLDLKLDALGLENVDEVVGGRHI